MYSVVPTFKPNGGIALNSPEEFLGSNQSPYSRNMEYFDDYEQTRLGLIKFDSAVLSGPVLHQKVFKRSDESVFYLFCTTKDIYSYDFSSLKFDILTPLYQTGKLRFNNGIPQVYGGVEVDNCDETLGWTDGGGGHSTLTRTTTAGEFQEGTAAIKNVVSSSSGANELLAYHNISSINISTTRSIGFWFKSTVGLSAGDLQFLLDNSSACASPLETLNIPAITANTWTWVSIPFATPANLTAIISIGIKQVVDKGAFTYFIDQVVAGSLTLNTKAGDFIKVGSGNVDTNSTWYTIQSVDSDTSMTLTINYAGSSVYQQPFVIRQTFTGDSTNYWFSAPFVDLQLGDTWLAVNGSDAAIYWAGSGQVQVIPRGNVNYTFTVTSANATEGDIYSNNGQDFVVQSTISSETTLLANGTGFADVSGTLTKVSGAGDSTITFTSSTFITGLPAGFIARYIEVYKDRVIFGWTIEGGQNNTRRLRFNDVATIFSWPTSNFEDLLDEDTEIRGLCVFDDYLMVGKEKEWYVGRPDPTTFIFDFDHSSTAEGLTSQGSVVVRKDWVYFYGHDKKFHRWNILRDDIISEGIFPETKNFDQNLEQYIAGADFYNKNQIRWMCPYTSTTTNNYMVVYDYRVNTIRVWDCSQVNGMASMGFYILQQDLYMDDSVWGEFYLDVTDGYFDDVIYLANAPIFIYGGYDGIIRKCDQGPDDDGIAYNRIFRSTRQNFNMPDQYKRLWKQQFWFLQDPVAVVTVKMKKDDNTSYEGKQQSLVLADNNRDVVKLLATWDKEAQDFQIELSATSFFALMGWLSYVMPKRKIKN